MKKIMLSVLVLGILFASSCSKNSPTPSSNRPFFQWTYNGVTLSADTALASNPNQVVSYYGIYAQTGAWGNPGTSFQAYLTSFAVGSYSGNGYSNQNSFAEDRNPIEPFTLNITSNSNGKISGNWSGTENNLPITGTFSNVPIVQ